MASVVQDAFRVQQRVFKGLAEGKIKIAATDFFEYSLRKHSRKNNVFEPKTRPCFKKAIKQPIFRSKMLVFRPKMLLKLGERLPVFLFSSWNNKIWNLQ